MHVYMDGSLIVLNETFPGTCVSIEADNQTRQTEAFAFRSKSHCFQLRLLQIRATVTAAKNQLSLLQCTML